VTSPSGVEVVGLARFTASLDDAARELEEPDALEDAGRVVQLRASSNAPKLSGTLSRSIRADAGGQDVTVGSDVVYAGVQEYGSAVRNIPAQPYLRPALEDSTGEVVDLFARDAQKALSHVKGA
jgi:HK97 gp10 family phage protein